MKLFLSPHNDDECLFGALTIQREKPLVVVVFDSHLQAERGNPVTLEQRRAETISALRELGHSGCEFIGIPDNHNLASNSDWIAGHLRCLLRERWDEREVEHAFAPAIENGHEQHTAVGRAADTLWPGRVTHYLTYTRDKGKSTSANRVPVKSGEWIRRKLRALACYESQIDIATLGCREHFCRDLWEYYA
jgi:LmbE family N-acetylglucosaminyl deacetylase